MRLVRSYTSQGMIIETVNDNRDNRDPRRRSLTGRPCAQPQGAGIGAVVGGRTGEGGAVAIASTCSRADRSAASGGREPTDNRPNVNDHGPAYGFGLSARGRYPGRDFDDVESQLSSEWAGRGASILSWRWARHAARDAWDHISPSRSLCA